MAAAIFEQHVVDTFPARTIRSRAVKQNNIANAVLFILRWESTAR